MKILLIKMSSMGDVVHAMPVLSDMMQHHPDAVIDWLVEDNFADLVRANAPLVRRVIPIKLRAWRKTWRTAATRQQWRAFKANLQSQSYDVVIDCQGLLKSAVVSRLVRLNAGGRRVGFDVNSSRESLSSWFYSEKHAVSREWPAVMRNRWLCAQTLGYSIDTPPQVHLAALSQYAAPRDDWRNPTSPYVVLIPNASRASKRWAGVNWCAVAAQCAAAGFQTVWFWGGVDELTYTEALLDGLSAEHRKMAHLPPFLSITQSAQCMQDAHCVVGLDSGLTHLAAALGKPTLGVFCDHDAALAPITAHAQDASQVASLGGIGQPPSLEAVQAVLAPWLAA